MSHLFHCYGENAFTFLAFQSLFRQNAISVLIQNLKLFGSNSQAFPWKEIDPKAEPDLWLFPNFGKGQFGFGEPDALLVLGAHSFWFEVETRIDMQRKRPALKQSLRQLLRFHCLAHALSQGGRTRTPATGKRHRAIMGLTVGDGGIPKLGILRIAGHGVLQEKIGDPLRKSYESGNSHYVLMCQGKPKGPGCPEKYGTALGEVFKDSKKEFTESLHEWQALTGSSGDVVTQPPEPDVARFWYIYWDGDLKDKFKQFVGATWRDPLEEGGYVSIKR